MKQTKGFFFVVIMFLILSFILASLSLFVRSTQLAEERYATQFQATNLELVLHQVDEPQINRLVGNMMYNSFFRLNNYVSKSPQHTIVPGVYEDNDEPEIKRQKLSQPVYAVIKQLFMDGRADGSFFNDGVELSLTNNGVFSVSMNQWSERLDHSLNQMGLKLVRFSIPEDGVTIVQTDVHTFHYTIENMQIDISDSTGRINFNKVYPLLEGDVDISGFTDSAVKNTGRDLELSLSRPIYFKLQDDNAPAGFEDAYNSPADLNPTSIVGGEAGQGWFYGPLAYAGAADDVDRPDGVKLASDVLAQDREKYILVGTYSQITDFDSTPGIDDNIGYESFGAYLVTTEPLNVEGNCAAKVNENELNTFNALQYDAQCSASYDPDTKTDNPFLVADGFDASEAPLCPQGRCALIMNKYSFENLDSNERRPWKIARNQPAPSVSVLYNVERLRDFVLCGYSIRSEKGPSFTQRLLTDSYNLVDSDTDLLDAENGYSTILFGQSLIPDNGDISDFDDLSKVDFEFFAGVDSVQRVRGLPGCRDSSTCDSPDNPVGHVTFSTGADGTMVQYLGNVPLSCALNPGAPCGDD